MNSYIKKHILIFVGFVWILIGLDALTKYFALEYFQQKMEIIPNILSLVYAQNTGIAFSIPLEWFLLKVVTLALIFWIFYYYWKHESQKNNKILHISFALIFAWALWNAWERIFIGYVTDFISLQWFAIFNLADSYISLWAVWLAFYYWKYTP
jgi:signal peptidase II